MSKLTETDEVLYRQIHPEFFTDGEPSSDRFKPYASDNGLMSTDRSSLATPQESHSLYVSQGRLSAAVFGISVEEFGAETIDCIADPVKDRAGQLDNPAHALADYRQHDPKRYGNIAKRLKKLAMARGCLHK